MRMIALSIDPIRVSKLRRVWRHIEVFEGTHGCGDNYREVCIPDAHHRFAEWAVDQGLGLETMFMQDDVMLPTGGDILERMTAEADAELVVFGETESSGIVVPKAFTAAPYLWGLIAGVWTGYGRIGPAWMPIVQQYGVVLDVTGDLGG